MATTAAERFALCRRRRGPEAGGYCGQDNVKTAAGDSTFSPAAWCATSLISRGRGRAAAAAG
jgi:hypothetical protein